MKKTVSLLISILLLLSMCSISLAEEWICDSCGNNASGNFCNNCGAAKPLPEWVCPNCGNSATGNFCNNCGSPKPSAEVNGPISIDFENDSDFEAALNRGENTVGKVVRFKVRTVRPDSILGFNLWSGEHLNFVSSEPVDAEEGDFVVAKITDVSKKFGSWVLSYEILEISNEESGTITRDAIDEAKQVTVRAEESSAANKEKAQQFRTPGNIVTFGTYPQTREGTDRTPIEWIVLEYDAENNRALLLSRYGLETKRYNEKSADMTWEKCTLRVWLNDDFLKTAFVPGERSAILETDVDNSSIQGYNGFSTSGGNNTRDRIFLLSYAEANQYFGAQHHSVPDSVNNQKSRMAPTAYADAHTKSDCTTENGEEASYWWLRSPGIAQRAVSFVGLNGSIGSEDVAFAGGCIRPAFWIDLDSDIFFP